MTTPAPVRAKARMSELVRSRGMRRFGGQESTKDDRHPCPVATGRRNGSRPQRLSSVE